MISKIYDKMLYVYCYIEVVWISIIEGNKDFKANKKWLEKNKN